jgi:hypothetical protein
VAVCPSDSSRVSAGDHGLVGGDAYPVVLAGENPTANDELMPFAVLLLLVFTGAVMTAGPVLGRARRRW